VVNILAEPEQDIAEEELDSFRRVLATQQGGYEYAEFRDELRTNADIERMN